MQTLFILTYTLIDSARSSAQSTICILDTYTVTAQKFEYTC